MKKSFIFPFLFLKAAFLSLLLGAAGGAHATSCNASIYFTVRVASGEGTYTSNGSVLNIKTASGSNSIGTLLGWMNIDVFPNTPSAGDSCFVSTWQENQTFSVGNLRVAVVGRGQVVTNCGVFIGLPDGNQTYKGNARFNNLSWVWEVWGCPQMQVKVPIDISIADPSKFTKDTFDLFSHFKVSAGERSANLNGQVTYQRRQDVPSFLVVKTQVPTCSLSVPSQVVMPRVPVINEGTSGVVLASRRDIPITLNCNNNSGVQQTLEVQLRDANTSNAVCGMLNAAASSRSRAQIILFTNSTLQTPVCFNQSNFLITFDPMPQGFNGSQTKTISAAYSIPSPITGGTVFGNVQSTLVLNVIYP